MIGMAMILCGMKAIRKNIHIQAVIAKWTGAGGAWHTEHQTIQTIRNLIQIGSLRHSSGLGGFGPFVIRDWFSGVLRYKCCNLFFIFIGNVPPVSPGITQ